MIEGTEKAFQEAKADFAGKNGAFRVVCSNAWKSSKASCLIDNEAELINLVFLTAKKIALRDLEGNREAVLELIQNVVGESQANERMVVRLSNEDHYFLETLQDKSGKRIESLERVKFVSEDNIKSGGCLIETEFGSVDATVEERVERVWQTLHGAKFRNKLPVKKNKHGTLNLPNMYGLSKWPSSPKTSAKSRR